MAVAYIPMDLPVGGLPRLLSTPTTVAFVLAPGGRRRKALGSAKICGAAKKIAALLGKSTAINCYEISNVSNDHHCFLALIHMIHMIHSHFAKYDDFLDPTNSFVRLGGRNNLRMSSRVQMYEYSLCIYI